MQSVGDWDNQANQEKLDRLLASYREAVTTPEASPLFLPDLWNRIDSRRSFFDRLRWQASAFAAGAVTVLLILGFLVAQPGRSLSASDSTYVEALASQPDEAPEYAEVIWRNADYEASYQ